MFSKISDLEGGGGRRRQPDKSTHDRVAGSESKSTMFGSLCTRETVRVSVCPAGRFLRVCRGIMGQIDPPDGRGSR